MVWKVQKTATTIRKGINEMKHIVANTTLNLCRGRLREANEVECLEIALAEDMIAYRRSVVDAGLSTSNPCPSTRDPCPSTSYDEIGHLQTYMDIIDLISS